MLLLAPATAKRSLRFLIPPPSLSPPAKEADAVAAKDDGIGGSHLTPQMAFSVSWCVATHWRVAVDQALILPS